MTEETALEPVPGAKRVALTFDDGPSQWTPMVRELLREHEGRATFFLIGARVREHPEEVRKIVAHGHEVGSHTLTHPRLTEIPDDEVRAEIAAGVETLAEVLGEPPRLFRAPGFHADYPPPPTSSRDDCTPTVEALGHLLPCLREEGYELVTVSELRVAG